MEKISYKLVFNRKKKFNDQGRALVQVEAYLNKKKMYFSTRIYLKPEQWDTKR
ncbi:Arm DNA-binding domain-containing protein, partial [Bacteroides pyogenes]